MIPIGAPPEEVTIYPTTDTIASHLKGIAVGDAEEYKTIEYRTRAGYDTNLPGTGVVLHRNLATQQDWSFLIDTTPGDNNLDNAQLTPGKLFVDPQQNMGIKFLFVQPDGGARILLAPTLSTQSLTVQGMPRIGSSVQFAIRSQVSAGLRYVLALAFAPTPPIILPDGRPFRLALDPLLMLSLATPSGILSNSQGTLDSNGEALVTLLIPNRPAIRGLTVYAAYLTLAQNNQVVAMSQSIPVTFI